MPRTVPGIAREVVGWALAATVLLLAPLPVTSQDVVSRTPNLSGGWVGTPGTGRFNFNHRFWLVGGEGNERKVVNSPTLLLGFQIPGGLLVGGQYASNSLVVQNTFNEWEGFVRWAPPSMPGPVGMALTAGYNSAAKSLDGEVSLRLPFDLPEGLPGDSIQVLGAVRGFSDALGTGERGWFGGVGLIIHLSASVALALDGGRLESDGLDLLPQGVEVQDVWGAGIQLRIPTTPHSLSINATNTRTGTLQGASAGRRTAWGFEFTVPLYYSRLFR
ncbi:MAG: hypothetical protein EXR92_01590 [Gemmatimonadetes bacterium]|nr:hypothetical protein [Gemmatimonadota bacterium]